MDQFIKTPKLGKEERQFKITVCAFSFFLLCFAGLAALGQSHVSNQYDRYDNHRFIAQAFIADRA